MNRLFRALLACACLTGLSLGLSGSSQAQESPPPTLAVLPLQSSNLSSERAKMLSHRLRKLMARKYNRGQIDYEPIDKSGGFDCSNAQCAAEKGRQLNADQVMFGEIRSQQKDYRLHLTLIDTRTGAVLKEMSDSCSYCEFEKVLKNLAPETLQDMGFANDGARANANTSLAQWENYVGFNVMFDYPAELELRDKVFSHRSGSYLYMLNRKDNSPFYLSIMEFKKPDTASWNGLGFMKDQFREDYVLNEDNKVRYNLGNKQVEGIPFMSKPGKENPNKGIFLLFENSYTLYQIKMETNLNIPADGERVVNQFLTEFLKTVYVD